MSKHYGEFDVLRVMALAMILLCHFIRGHQTAMVDVPLGIVGNCIFFALSGWLLGFKWRERGCPVYGRQFLVRRLLRLSIPIWLFAIPWMIWLKLNSHSISLLDVILNLSLLNWFAKLPGLATYWFVTAIALFYSIIVALSKMPCLREWKWNTVVTLFVGAAMLSIVSSSVGVRQGYVFMLFMLGAWMFLFGDMVRAYGKTYAKLNLLIGVVGIVIVWQLFCAGKLQVGSAVGYWLSLPSVLLISIGVVAMFDQYKCPKVIRQISAISYEIYLAHSALLGVTHTIVHDNIWMYAVVWMLMTVVAAIALHWVSSILNERVRIFLK